MHRLLARQIRRHLGEAEVDDAWRGFLDAVDEAYHQADGDRRMLERSLELSSDELVEANRRLRETLEAMRRKEADYRGLFEAARDAMLLIDAEDATITAVNLRACRMYGYEEKEMVGGGLDLFTEGEAARRRIAKILEDGRLPPFEAVHHGKDGRVMTVEVHAALVDYQGRWTVLAINRDVSERARFIAELEAKSSEIERLTYTVSHDLKSPVFTIQGFLGLLEKDIEAGNREAIDSDLAQVRNAAAHVRRLLDDLLELSRVGRLSESLEPIDLGELAREAVGCVAGQIHERGVEVTVGDDLPTIVGDRGRLLEVLQNLVENAVKFMGGQERPHIEIGTQEIGTQKIGAREDGAREDGVVLYVRDNGSGIDAQHLDKVFGLFDRFDHEGEGTGIGLAVVKKVVEAHGGCAWAESDGRGHGSTFFLALPAAPPGAAAAPPL